MAKRPANAKDIDTTGLAVINATTPEAGIAALVVGDPAGLPAGNQVIAGSTGGDSGQGAVGENSGEPSPVVVTNETAPAQGDASAGTTEAGGVPASSSGDQAGSSEHSILDMRVKLPFQDPDGVVRPHTEYGERVLMTKNVKINGVQLEAGAYVVVPIGIAIELDDLDAIED